ncbi:MAG: hypothetical protein K2H89_01680 [Oscillospiraceae bacterium]|nr:hypothetical protein [Oscillospiraceae bacterium]
MDILVENLKKVEDKLTNPELAQKWGLLTLCRMETSFHVFQKADNKNIGEIDFNFSEILNECIAYICRGIEFPVQNRIQELAGFLNQLYAYEEQHPDDFLCLYLYFSQELQDLYGYLEILAGNTTDPVQLNIDDLILSAISEDFFIDFHELESIEDFAEHPLVLEEIQRIWEDYKFIQDCTNEQLQNRAESYRKLNVQAIPENWSLQS